MRKFDAHTHSSISDGTDTPGHLVRAAHKAGLDIISLTDHDTFLGIEEATQAAKQFDLTVVAGVELSSMTRGISAHILAYIPDRSNVELLAVMEKIRHSRLTRIEKMAKNLASDYPDADWQKFGSKTRGTWGRPHLADALVEAGYFSERDGAFKWVLSPTGPYYVPQWAPGAPEMVEIIRGASGVPVLAHPFSNRRRPLPKNVIEDMIEAGLFAFERDHREHDGWAREEIDRLARLTKLETTGGSDYHGAGKPNRLGENLTDTKVLEKILEQGHQER